MKGKVLSHVHDAAAPSRRLTCVSAASGAGRHESRSAVFGARLMP